jgi:hypothetical protein
LDEVKEFNEEIASARPSAKERMYLGKGGIVERAAFRASLALPSAGSKVFSLRVHRGSFIQGEGGDRPNGSCRPLHPFRPLSDYEHDGIGIVVGALDQISGGVDKIRDVDRSERIGAGDFEAIARSRSFQRFVRPQRGDRTFEAAQVEFPCCHRPSNGQMCSTRQWFDAEGPKLRAFGACCRQRRIE